MNATIIHVVQRQIKFNFTLLKWNEHNEIKLQ